MFSNMILAAAASGQNATIAPGAIGTIFSLLPLVFFALIGIYLIPSLVALATRNHRTKVILFNIFLGWTLVMWIVCLVWACKKEEKSNVIKPIVLKSGLSPADELKTYKDLLDSGAISQEEYEEKKKQLLNL